MNTEIQYLGRAVCHYCGADPHTLGECPACGNDEDVERELKRLNAEVRRLRAGIEEIMSMAVARKSCIRMPDGSMLDNYCRRVLALLLQ